MYYLILALTPIIICLFWIYLKDKYQKEPIKVLLKYFVFGIICGSLAFYIEEILLRVNIFIGHNYDIYVSYVVSGLVEEGIKFIILFILLTYEKEFDERIDAIIYSVFLSLGFAFVENFIYIIYEEKHLVYQVSILRTFISIPAHISFSITMGYYLSKFRFERKREYIVLAFLLPVILHGTFNFILTLNKNYSLVVFIVFIAFLLKTNFDKLEEFINLSERFNKRR